MSTLVSEIEQEKKSKKTLDDTVDKHLSGSFGPTHEDFDTNLQFEQDTLQASYEKSIQESQSDAWRSGPGGASGSVPSLSFYRSTSA